MTLDMYGAPYLFSSPTLCRPVRYYLTPQNGTDFGGDEVQASACRAQRCGAAARTAITSDEFPGDGLESKD